MRTAEICTRTTCITFATAILLTTLFATSAHAQLNGENLLGDMGVKSGTQPEPGLYVSTIYYRYRADSLKDAAGRSVDADPTGDASQTINAGVPLVYYVTPKKVFGALVLTTTIPVGGIRMPGKS